MGQAHSHFERPIGLWRHRKSKGARSEPSQESFVQLSPPPPEADRSSAQMNQSSAHADQSSTTANKTPVSAAPYLDMRGDTTAEPNGKVGEADNVDKVEGRTNSPHDQPMPDLPDLPDKADQSTQAVEESTASRPALKREDTPPHRIRIWTGKAWRTEQAYSKVHNRVTKTLNSIREQQVESKRTGAAARRMESDIYKAADSCTLALEYLVGNFSTKFFHHDGPESIMGMMATIDADAGALEDLRLKQYQMANYGYSLEKKIAQTEGHIRELAEVAKRIKEGTPTGHQAVHQAEDGEADADGDTDYDLD